MENLFFHTSTRNERNFKFQLKNPQGVDSCFCIHPPHNTSMLPSGRISNEGWSCEVGLNGTLLTDSFFGTLLLFFLFFAQIFLTRVFSISFLTFIVCELAIATKSTTVVRPPGLKTHCVADGSKIGTTTYHNNCNCDFLVP